MNILRFSPVVVATLTWSAVSWSSPVRSAEVVAAPNGPTSSLNEALLDAPIANSDAAVIVPTETALVAMASAKLTVADLTPAAPSVRSAPIAQAFPDQESPNKIQISPNQPPTVQPSLQTPVPPAIPENKLPPAPELQLPTQQPTAVPATPPPGSPKPGSPKPGSPKPGSPAQPPAQPPAPLEAPTPGTETGGAEPRVLVSEVVVSGAKGDLENTVYQAIRTKPGQTATRTQLQEDINAIFATGYFANVKATPEDTPLGVRVTFDVESNPVLKTVQVSGNTVIPAAEVDEIFKDQYGTILNLRQLQRGVQELSKRYQDKGYVLAQVVDVPKIGADGTVTLDVAEGLVETVEVKFLNKQGEDKDAKGNLIKGRTRPYIVTREFQTKPGQVFNRNIAERDLQRVFGLGIFDDVKLSLNPGQDPRKVVVVANVVERSPGSISAGGGVSSASGLFGTVSYQQQNLAGRNQKFGAEFEIGQREALFDLNFTDPWIAGDPYRTSYNINAFRRRTISLIFDGGQDVRIQNNNGVDTDRPVIIRTGGGVTFSRPLSKDVFSTSPWSASLGFGYQQVLIQDADGRRVKGNTPQLNDAGQVVGVGSDLSFSGTGKDDLLTVQLGVLNDRRNDPLRPTSGSILRLGTEQSIPLGSGNILFNRLRGSYSFYQPTRLLKLTPECQNRNSKLVPALQKQVGPCQQAFAFNVQAGTVLGDLPPYEAFSLGGSNSVRGYDEGEVGSGKTFLQATAEYRFPVFSIVSGALFVDAGTDLGSGSSVKGDPAGLRQKPGNGVGYGLGLRIQSPLGPIRVDYGFGQNGKGRFHFGIGERF